MSRSWMWAAKELGFTLSIAAPQGCLPTEKYLERLGASNISITTDPIEAVKDADVVNTDVWLSMGPEGQKDKEALFENYQVNSKLLQHATPSHIVLHCLPAYRGKEITAEVLEAHADSIFQQAENRLHAQKSVLSYIAEHSS